MSELEPDAGLPPMPPGQQVIEDYRHLHLSLKAHPVSFLRADLDARGIVAPRAPGRHSVRPRASPSPAWCWCASGPGIGNVIFMTLEDETGIANTIVGRGCSSASARSCSARG